MEPPPPPPPSATGAVSLPRLPILTSDELSKRAFGPLQKRINSGADVSFFLTSRAYKELMVWIMQLNHSLIPRLSPDTARPVCFPLEPGRRGWSEPVRRLREMLGGCEELILEAPPEENKNRRYLEVVRKLITTYTLEPAGSHGVWGLDDHSFVPYIFGSAQFTKPILGSRTEATPVEGSCPGAPKPASAVDKQTVEDYRRSNMYFGAIGFIYDVKRGPFWEHSPMLFDISGIKDGWGKINKGMVKMYRAEVLGKFPVVQHFGFGGLWAWEVDPEMVGERSVHLQSQPVQNQAQSLGQGGGEVGTKAPWARELWGHVWRAGEPMDGGVMAPTGFPGRQPGMGTPTGLPGRGQVPTPRGGIPNTGPMEQTSFPRGGGMQDRVGGNQFSVTKAPWAKD
ncbi:Serine/threonine-protein phosphatase 2A activator 1 [Podospora pseudoanserina]|uniref:Serine/threonine-protein phosphatase 2A activator n=1 Tax=Podospora pseudoanserina TaxID=2609844 RepID=A0ABR0I9D8_9PEZI|nr:Serine/threonine-protein phosphatase 2A activator 1 [Podospora pseudoanserina]